MVIYSNVNFSLEQNFLTYVIATCPSLVANRSFYVIANDFFHIYFDLIFPFNNSCGLLNNTKTYLTVTSLKKKASDYVFS